MGCSGHRVLGRVVGERPRRRGHADDQLAVVGGGSGCLAVLVDESAAGGVSSDRLARPIGDDRRVVGCALPERPVGSVVVVVLDVVVQKPLEVLAIPDEGAVAELAAHGADPPFRVRVRDRCARRYG